MSDRREPKMAFEDTFSAETVILEKFFGMNHAHARMKTAINDAVWDVHGIMLIDPDGKVAELVFRSFADWANGQHYLSESQTETGTQAQQAPTQGE